MEAEAGEHGREVWREAPGGTGCAATAGCPQVGNRSHASLYLFHIVLLLSEDQFFLFYDVIYCHVLVLIFS